MCVCARALSRPGTGGLLLAHSWLACAAVVADISTGANADESGARSVFIDQNLAGVGGLHPKPAVDPGYPGTLERDSVTDGQCAVQQFESERKTSQTL